MPGDGRADTNEAIVAMLARQRGVNFAPGTQYQYNNGAYSLLGTIVKRVSGQSLRTFASANIFTPLGMTSTYFRDDPRRSSPIVRSGIHETPAACIRRRRPSARSATLDCTQRREICCSGSEIRQPRVGTSTLLAEMQTPTMLAGGNTSA